MKRRGIIAVLVILLSFSIGVVAEATEQTARLKKTLQTDYMYFTTTISSLNSSQANDNKSFGERYKDRYVVLSGRVGINCVSKNLKEITIWDEAGKNKCLIDSSDVVNDVKGLSSGSNIRVFGKVDITGISNDSYKIIAKKIVKNPAEEFVESTYVFYENNNIVPVKTISDLTADKRVMYNIPSSWSDKKVCSALTNNDVKGYQYYLNALPPYDTKKPEIFYIFYFENERYLEKPPKNANDGDNEYIEEAIVRNILQQFDEETKINVDDIKDFKGTEYDYFSKMIRVGGIDYRAEFVFIPDNAGITCMMYLYFPSESSVHHTEEVAYVVETMKVNN